jgi:FMN-dependent NADH-azoreductase
MNVLQVNSSARRVHDDQGSFSTRLAGELSAGLLRATPGATLTVRDLAANPHPALDEAALQALFTPAEQRTPEQAARVAQDDALIAEVQAADVLVLGAPMVNFAVTAQLKHWIDAIARARVTFRYTENGPEGLLKGKRVFIVLTRGGVYRDQPFDHQVPYLRQVLGFLGLTDITFVYAEGLAMGPEAEAKALAEAREQIRRTLDAAAPQPA